jgi:hypothetical protein
MLPYSAAAKDTPEVARFEENNLRIAVLSVLCDFLFCIFTFANLQPQYLA